METLRAMIDADLVRQKIELARETMEAVDPTRVSDQITKLRVETLQEHCGDLIQALQIFLNGTGIG
jgi:hypothetical protein